MTSVKLQLSQAILERRVDDVLHILAQGGPTLVKSGLLDPKRTLRLTFAEFCINADATSVLAEVSLQRPGGVGLDDCVNLEWSSGALTMQTAYDLPDYAVRYVHRELFEVLLECRRNQRPSEVLLQGVDQMHASLLSALLSHGNMARVDRMLELVRRLIEVGAPFAPRSGQEESLATMMLGQTWQWKEPLASRVRPLLRDYVRAGYMDIDAPLPNDDYGLGGKTPLLAAIIKGSTPAACELIELGCDWKRVLFADYDDLRDVVRTYHPGDAGEAMAAALNESLMRVRVKELAGAAPTTEVETRVRRHRGL